MSTTPTISGLSVPPMLVGAVAAWLERELEAARREVLDHAGWDPEHGITLEAVFQDLPARLPWGSDVSDVATRMLDRLRRPAEAAEDVGIPPVVGDDGARLCWLLVGGPGQGKSTLLRHVAQVHRVSLLDAGGALEQAYAAHLQLVSVPRLPVFVEARRLAAYLHDHADADLISWLATRLGVAVDELSRWVREQPLLVLLDGLDEAPSAEARERVLRAVQGVSLSDDTAVIASSRPTGTGLAFREWPEVALKPLGPKPARVLAAGLVAERYRARPERRAQVSTALERDLRRPEVLALTTTPLQVAMVVALVEESGRAPTERWRLLEGFYDLVFKREVARDTPMAEVLREHGDLVREVHRTAALLLQVRSEVAGGEEARLQRTELSGLIRAQLRDDGGGDLESHRLAARVLRACTERLVLLVARDQEGALAFEVRLLQEGLAAEALVRGDAELVLARLKRLAAPAAWYEVRALACSRLASTRPDVLERVLDLLPELDTDELGAIALPGARWAMSLVDRPVARKPRVRRRLVAEATRAFAVVGPVAESLVPAAKQALLERPWWEVAGAWGAVIGALSWDELVERLPKEQEERVGLWEFGRGRWAGGFPWWLGRPARPTLSEFDVGEGTGLSAALVCVGAAGPLYLPEARRTRWAFDEDWASMRLVADWWHAHLGPWPDGWVDHLARVCPAERAELWSFAPWPLRPPEPGTDPPASVVTASWADLEEAERVVLEVSRTVDGLVEALRSKDELVRWCAQSLTLRRGTFQPVSHAIAGTLAEEWWPTLLLLTSDVTPEEIDEAPYVPADVVRPDLDLRLDLVEALVRAARSQRLRGGLEGSSERREALVRAAVIHPPAIHLLAFFAADFRATDSALPALVPDAYSGDLRVSATIVELVRTGGDLETFRGLLFQLDAWRAADVARHLDQPAQALAAVAHRLTGADRARLAKQTVAASHSKPTGLHVRCTWQELQLPPLPPTNSPTLTRSPLHGDACLQLRQLRVRDLGGIAELDLELPLPDDPDRGQWLLLLGENGTGKTTLLRGLALAAGGQLRAAAALAQLSSPIVRTGAASACVNAELADGTHWSMSVDGQGAPKLEGDVPWFFAAYGVDRGTALGGPERAVQLEKPWAGIASLFGDATEGLIHAETWLDQFRAAPDGDWRAEVWAELRPALCGLLPEVEDLELTPDGVLATSATFGTVSLAALSDGYLSTVGWVIDMVARWLHAARKLELPISGDFPRQMTGLVLLDELDQHLHPSWQRRVIGDLRALFPRMSFVVTTHNPLPLQGAQRGEVVVLRRQDREVQAHQIDLPPGLDAAQVLTGPWFDLETTLDEGTLDLLERNQLALLAGEPDVEVQAELRARTQHGPDDA